jgi:5-formyltetrahydrofolate cyclo-ligase
MPKNAVRQRLLAQRYLLEADQAREMSVAAQQQLLELPQFSRARSIALYAAIKGEVGTELLCEAADRQGKAVLFPAVSGHSLEFRQWSHSAAMVVGRFGIAEPGADAKVWAPEQIDLVVVPGVAFDRRGHRIGYGKGYYDRTLHLLEGKDRLFGLCYDFQLIDEIPEIPHDVRMDGVVTEHRVLYPCD